MADKVINKVIYGGKVLLDLTSDTIEPSDLKVGATAHDKTGNVITGTNTFDSDTSDADVAVSEILEGKTAYARGTKITGTMKDNGAFNDTISTINEEVTIPIGYHDGSGKVKIDETEQAKLVGKNIKKGVEVLGVTGTLDPAEEVKVQPKSATPKVTAQTILPDEGFDYLTQVTVDAIPYVETDNSAGGKTATIAGV